VPVLAQMAGWGCKFLPVTDELGIRGKLLEEGGPKMWEKFMSDLRVLHLSARRKSRSGTESVSAKLHAAHAAVVARGKAKVRGRFVKSRVAKRTGNGQRSKRGN
jgi:hypothetical protein